MANKKYAYCLYHNRWFTKDTLKPKCKTSKYKQRKQCKYLIILEEDKDNGKIK